MGRRDTPCRLLVALLSSFIIATVIGGIASDDLSIEGKFINFIIIGQILGVNMDSVGVM